MAGYIFVVSAPSAAGKTTLVNSVLDSVDPQRLSRVITYTTRAPRKGEQHGVDYYFIDEDTFWRYQRSGAFIEYSGAYGAWYASAWASIDNIPDNTGRVMVIDRFGAQRVLHACNNVVAIWIMPPSADVLHERLEARGASEGDIAHRIAQSQKDIAHEEREQMYHHWVYNNNFAVAKNMLKQCISAYLPVNFL